MARKQSGKAKTFEERKAAGLRPVFVWLDVEAAANLDEAVQSTGQTMTEIINTLLHAPPKATPEKRASPKPASNERAVDLAERVREKGARRQALVVATGQVSADGRVRSKP